MKTLVPRTSNSRASTVIQPRMPSKNDILLNFSLTVRAATLIFISGRDSAISSAKEGKSGFINDLVKS